MPLMNGIEFYKKPRKNPSWTPIPIIFLTANDSPEDIQVGRELGVEDYLIKPIDYDNLLKIFRLAWLALKTSKLPTLARHISRRSRFWQTLSKAATLTHMGMFRV